MKLYTEETVKFIAKAIYEHDFDSNKTPEELVDELKPIELPSDKEIESEASDFVKKYRGTTYEKSAFVLGAKWFKEQITKTK